MHLILPTCPPFSRSWGGFNYHGTSNLGGVHQMGGLIIQKNDKFHHDGEKNIGYDSSNLPKSSLPIFTHFWAFQKSSPPPPGCRPFSIRRGGVSKWAPPRGLTWGGGTHLRGGYGTHREGCWAFSKANPGGKGVLMPPGWGRRWSFRIMRTIFCIILKMLFSPDVPPGTPFSPSIPQASYMWGAVGVFFWQFLAVFFNFFSKLPKNNWNNFNENKNNNLILGLCICDMREHIIKKKKSDWSVDWSVGVSHQSWSVDQLVYHIKKF